MRASVHARVMPYRFNEHDNEKQTAVPSNNENDHPKCRQKSPVLLKTVTQADATDNKQQPQYTIPPKHEGGDLYQGQ